jgi:hypothetical protein
MKVYAVEEVTDEFAGPTFVKTNLIYRREDDAERACALLEAHENRRRYAEPSFKARVQEFEVLEEFTPWAFHDPEAHIGVPMRFESTEHAPGQPVGVPMVFDDP